MDHLLGLKENVIIGKLIPAGSGLTQYRKFDTFDEEGNLTSQKSGTIVADALEDEGEAEIAGETELELEETGVLELESPASEEEQAPVL